MLIVFGGFLILELLAQHHLQKAAGILQVVIVAYARPSAQVQVLVPAYPVAPPFPSAYHPPSIPGRYP